MPYVFMAQTDIHLPVNEFSDPFANTRHYLDAHKAVKYCSDWVKAQFPNRQVKEVLSDDRSTYSWYVYLPSSDPSRQKNGKIYATFVARVYRFPIQGDVSCV